MIYLCFCLLLCASAAAQSDDVVMRGRAADRAIEEGRLLDGLAEWRKVTELAPSLPAGWYALGQAYNAVKLQAIGSFDQAEGAAWRQLLAADAWLGAGRMVDAFTLYRESLARLPSMVSAHDSIARIYEQTGHPDWAARERAAGVMPSDDCANRKALCAFRSGVYLSVLTSTIDRTDAESRYWRARAANELALEAFRRLDALADSVERRAVRAARARAEERNADAIAELRVALTFAPGAPALVYDLAATYYAARDYEPAVATLAPIAQTHPDEARFLKLLGYALLRLRRVDEALPVLQRAAARESTDPGLELALGQAYLLNGDFAAAIPLIEAQLADDRDGSVHVQLARAYTGVGQRDKAAPLLERSQQLQRAADDRNARAAERTITPPK